jgi:hypothetical protein
VTLLGRDAILAASDATTEDVDVPEWGGTVRVRGLSGTERDQFEASMLVKRGRHRDVTLINARAKLVSLAVIDESGERVFSDSDVAELGHKSAAALTRVYEVASRLSGLSEADVDELEGNFGAAPSGASTSDSPAT